MYNGKQLKLNFNNQVAEISTNVRCVFETRFGLLVFILFIKEGKSSFEHDIYLLQRNSRRSKAVLLLSFTISVIVCLCMYVL